MNFDFTNAINEVKNNATDSYKVIYDNSISSLRKITKYYLNSYPDYEDDVLQETYVKIFTKLDTLEDPSQFISWAKTICRNLCLNFIKAQNIRLGHELPIQPVSDDDTGSLEELAKADIDFRHDPVLLAEENEISELILEKINLLPEAQRSCFLMCAAQMSMNEISEKLNMAPGTVRSNIRYARKKLQKMLEAEGFSYLKDTNK